MWLCFLVCPLPEKRSMAIHIFFPFVFHVYFLWLHSRLFLYLHISEVSVWHVNVVCICFNLVFFKILNKDFWISWFYIFCHHLLILENYWPLSHQKVFEQTFLLSFHLGPQLHMLDARYCPMTVCYFHHCFLQLLFYFR